MVEEMNIWSIFLTVVIIGEKKAFSYLYSCKSSNILYFYKFCFEDDDDTGKLLQSKLKV